MDGACSEGSLCRAPLPSFLAFMCVPSINNRPAYLLLVPFHLWWSGARRGEWHIHVPIQSISCFFSCGMESPALFHRCDPCLFLSWFVIVCMRPLHQEEAKGERVETPNQVEEEEEVADPKRTKEDDVVVEPIQQGNEEEQRLQGARMEQGRVAPANPRRWVSYVPLPSIRTFRFVYYPPLARHENQDESHVRLTRTKTSEAASSHAHARFWRCVTRASSSKTACRVETSAKSWWVLVQTAKEGAWWRPQARL